ncbi:MAG: dTMP kinase [Candidatus Norongarragalinales archaeon]
MALIVFEGIDASGKKTQAELLVKNLKRSGKKAVLMDFPSYATPVGKLIALYLKGKFGGRGKVSKHFASLLYALDRYSRKGEIEDYLRKGFIVVLDRYTQANLAYQTAGLTAERRRRMLEWIERVEQGLPKADIVIFLDVPPVQSGRLIEKRKNKIRGVKKDIHEKDAFYANAVYDNYLRLAKEKHWLVIKCMENGRLKGKEEVSMLVFSKLRERKII